MRKALIPFAALAAAAAAAPAAADPGYEPVYDREPIAEALPDAAEVQAMTHGLDRLLGALLRVDVGPLLDAADPHRDVEREVTLGEVAGGDDPYFEDRMRSNLYGTSAAMGRMFEAFAVMAPALRRSLETIERDVEAAMGEARRR